jgi:hypothetical protein
MSKNLIRRGVNQSLSQQLASEYIEYLAQKRLDKENKKPRIVANKNK